MPKPAFFRSLGLYVQDEFLDESARMRIQTEILAAELESARIIEEQAGSEIVDETVRKVLRAKVAPFTVACMEQRLLDLKPRLEDHFKISLSGFEPPDFLRYRQGAFYQAHWDERPEVASDVPQRRVSVVVFLNPQAKAPSPNCYGGGSLKFYGLLDGPGWENCALPIEAEPGLLVGFPSKVLHEVEPVTFGQRFTIVTWFTSSRTHA